VRIKVLDPTSLADLLAFLQAGDFTVSASGAGEATVVSPHGPGQDARDDLRLRIATWNAMVPGAHAELVD
jgi:hypothetical protein